MVPDIPLPKKVQLTEEKDNQGRFIVEPLYPGYGLTIGNALRRVLLSSLPGAAITAVKVKGIDHEFSTIPHVKEDVVEITLNLKQIRIKVEQDFAEPLKITFSGKGEKEIKAGDFECPSQISIANPDMTIAATTDAAANVDIECRVEQGRGYLPVEMKEEEERLEIGNMAIDTYFTPITKVSFKKENVRVGRMTNWDKLILDLETDGTISCQDAFDYATKILQEQFTFLHSGDIPQPDDDQKDKTQDSQNPAIEIDQTQDEPNQAEEVKLAPKKRGRPPKKTDK